MFFRNASNLAQIYPSRLPTPPQPYPIPKKKKHHFSPLTTNQKNPVLRRHQQSCPSPHRCDPAAGFDNVVVLTGGLQRWVEEGLPGLVGAGLSLGAGKRGLFGPPQSKKKHGREDFFCAFHRNANQRTPTNSKGIKTHFVITYYTGDQRLGFGLKCVLCFVGIHLVSGGRCGYFVSSCGFFRNSHK